MFLYLLRYSGIGLVLALIVTLAHDVSFTLPKEEIFIKEIPAVPEKLFVTNKELDCLIKNAYFEANTQGQIGRNLVTKVVINRARLWNKTFCSVVYQPSQFSWTRTPLRKIDERSYRKIKEEVIELLSDDTSIPFEYITATHFHATYVRPTWSKKLKRLGRYKQHIFYGEKE
jgi:spore germination cell wall hydrolase CwlJ-like protein